MLPVDERKPELGAGGASLLAEVVVVEEEGAEVVLPLLEAAGALLAGAGVTAGCAGLVAGWLGGAAEVGRSAAGAGEVVLTVVEL